MQIAFAGTPEFAARALQAILAADLKVSLVLTQPDRPAGRGMTLQTSAVKKVALEHNISVDQPERLRMQEQQAALVACQPDILVVAAYGLILPQAVLDLPRLGCINIHASLLPRWRGAAPIHRAIEAGDAETGITIMRMDAGLDTGPMLLKQPLSILSTDTTATLHDKLAALGGEMIVAALRSFNSLVATPQPTEGVTYAHKIDKSESTLDFRLPAVVLERKLRAFDPFPGGAATLGDTTIKLWRGDVIEADGAPGEVLAANANGIVVACCENALRLLELQKPSGKRLPVADFLRGFDITAGMHFRLEGSAA